MNIKDAVRILKAIADGVDPDSGEILDSRDLLQRPDIVRALNRVLGFVEGRANPDQRLNVSVTRAGKPWSHQEEAELINEVNKGSLVSEIAEHLCRTRGAIKSRIKYLTLSGVLDEVKDKHAKQSSDQPPSSTYSAKRAGEPWTPEEEHDLIEEFEQGLALVAIAKSHSRTTGAIVARLERLGVAERPLGDAPDKKRLDGALNDSPHELEDNATLAGVRLCQECGRPIPQERTEVAPDACLCVNCKREFENRHPGSVSRKVNEGIAGTREDNKRMRGKLWGEIKNRSRGHE